MSIITGLTGYNGKRVFNNMPQAFKPIESYDGGREAYYNSKRGLFETYSGLNQIDLQNTIFDTGHFQNFDINYSLQDSVFASQLDEWQALQKTLNSNKKTISHLISYDFETIGVRNAKAFDVNTSALTEFGFTDTLYGNGKRGISKSYSVAFGISQQQGKSFLSDINRLYFEGLDDIPKGEAGSIESTVERLSRYAGDVNTLFDQVDVGHLKNVVVINKLNPSSVANQSNALDGLMNLSILGGMDETNFAQMIAGSNLFDDTAVARFIAKKETFDTYFNNTYQVANENSKLLNQLKSKIVDASQKSNYHVLGYNINAFDNPIFNAIGDKNITLDSSKTLDVYSAFSTLGNGAEIRIAEKIALQHGADSVNFGKKVKEEGLAQALGLTFGDVAHNAASDTAIVNDIVLTKDFLNGVSLFDNITPKAKQGLDIFGENTVALALSSIHYDKNKQDLMMISKDGTNFEVANEFYLSGVNRNRYYHIDGILDNNGDGVLVQMTSAASGTKQRFYKHYASVEDANEDLRKNFIFEDRRTFSPERPRLKDFDSPRQWAIAMRDYLKSDKASAAQEYIDRQDLAYRGDSARREYERLFGTDSITSYWDSKNEKAIQQGGYDRLNQYYQAYKESAIKIKEHYGLGADDAISEKQLREIASSDTFDKTLEEALIHAGAGYDGTVAPSTLRDMKTLIGKFQDEAAMFDKLNENFAKDTTLDNYGRTMVASRFRDELIGERLASSDIATRFDEIKKERLKSGSKETNALVTDVFRYARRQDLFGIELSGNINKGDDIFSTVINFENERHATSKLYNTVMGQARSAKSGNVDDSAMRLMYSITRNLHESGYVSDDFFNSFSRSFSENQSMNYQPWRYAEWIVNEIRTNYVQPLQNIGFDLEKLQSFSYELELLNTDLIGNKKFDKLTASNVSPTMLHTIVKQRGEAEFGEKKIRKMIKNLDSETATQTILNILNVDADTIVRGHFADLTIHKMITYSGLYEDKAFGSSFVFKNKNLNLNDIYSRIFNSQTADDFINIETQKAGNIIYGISSKNAKAGQATVEEIEEKTKRLLGYDDATAKEVGRMFSYSKNRPYGLLTYAEEGASSGDKLDFITTFFHTGKEGDNGFVLLNMSEDVSNYNKMLNKLSRADSSNYRNIISEIQEEGYAAILPLPAIHDHSEIFKGIAKDGSEFPLLGGRIGLNGEIVPFEFKTMDYGNKNFQKVVRQSINFYRQDGSNNLKDLVMQQTDDAFQINTFYPKTRATIMDILHDESLSTGERYKRVSKHVKKFQNRVVKDDIMPGLSGASTVLKINGEYRKVTVPNMADMLQSQKINVSALKDLFIQTVADGLDNSTGLEKEANLKMANFVAQFVTHKNAETASDVVRKVAKEVATNRDYSFGAEFEEAFAKHLFALNIEEAEGYAKTAMPTGTIIDYLFDASEKGKYHQTTTNLVNMLYQNNKVGNISQILKEHDIENGYISLIDPMLFVPHSHMESGMRPVSVQQLTAGSYIKKDVEKELGTKFIKEMDIRLGYDAPSAQLETLRKNIKERYGYIYDDGKTKLSFSDLEQGISANFRQLSSGEAIDLIEKGKGKLRNLATTNYQEIAQNISKFQITESLNEELTREAYNLIRNNGAYNTWESKGFLNPVLANNSYFTAPSLRRYELSGTVGETQAKELANLIASNKVEVYEGFNLSQFYRKHTKRDLLVTDDIGGQVQLRYHGPKGLMLGTDSLSTTDDLINAFTTGYGYMREHKQGMMDAKVILGNEKMTVRVLEWEGHLTAEESGVYKSLRTLLENAGIKNADDQWNIVRQYVGNAFDSIFGEGVAGIVNLPLDKHINATAANYMNQILHFANSSLTGNYDYDKKNVIDRMNKLFDDGRLATKGDGYNSKFMGIVLKPIGEGKDLKLTYDTSMLKEEGAVQQIEHIVDIITNDTRPFFKPLRDSLARADELQLYRGTMVLGINQEAKGGELYMDARMAVTLRSKGTEKYEGRLLDFSKKGRNNFNFNSITDENGNSLLINDYIYDKIKQESLVGIDKVKYNEAGKTLRSMHTTLEAYGKGGSYHDSNILELQLDDIVISPEGYQESIDDYMRYGVFKFVEETPDGKYRTKYSKELQKAARKQRVNLDNVDMIKINLTEGLTYDLKTSDGKTKQMSSIFMPIMDVSPYGGEVYLTNTERNMMKVLNTAKTAKLKGINEAKATLSSNVENMMINFQHDMTNKKESYFSRRLMRFKMENSGLLFAENTKVPVVNASIKNRKRWLADEQYRQSVINAVKEGKAGKGISWDDIDMTENAFSEAKFSRKINGVMRYDDIVEIGREGFESKGVNFAQSGADILTNTDKYSRMARITADGTKGSTNINTILQLDAKRQELDKLAQKYGMKDSDEALRVIQRGNNGKFKRKRKAFLNESKELLEGITEDYLSKIGTFGLVGRYPTFQEGSLSYVITRLNKNLSRDELTVTPMLAQRLNMDHDGDNGILKLFLDKGKLLNDTHKDSKGNHLYRAIEKEYQDYLMSGRNNIIFGEMLEGISKQIIENGGKEVDLVSAICAGDRTYARAKTLQKTLTKKNKQGFLEELKQSDFSFGNIVLKTEDDIDALLNPKGDNVKFNTVKNRFEFTDDAQELINKLYSYQQKHGGNFLKSPFMKASSIKARITKNEIGFISNPNYHINQAMNEMLTRYIDEAEQGLISSAQMDKFLQLKSILHRDNLGFLPITEQSSIDVKHVVAGLSISETPKYSAGIKSIFNITGDAQKDKSSQIEGLRKLYNALQNNSKAIDTKLYTNASQFANAIYDNSLEYFIEQGDEKGQMFKALLEVANLANDQERKNITGKMSTLAQDIEDVYSFMEEVNSSLADYKSGHIVSMRTTRGLLMSELGMKIEPFKRAWYSNNGILQVLNEESVYFEKVKVGNEFFRTNAVTFEGFDIDDNGIYTLNFKNYSAKGTQSKSIVGNSSQIQAQLRHRFGAFDSLSKTEATLLLSGKRKGNETASAMLRNKIAEANAMHYLQLKAESELTKNRSYSSERYLKGVANKSELGYEETEALLKKIDSAFVDKKKAYLELHNNLMYIKNSNPMANYNAMPFDDALEELNRQIIKNASGKKTVTSVDEIFKNYYERIAPGSSADFNTPAYKHLIKQNKQERFNFKGFFNDFDNERIDMRLANQQLLEAAEGTDAKEISDAIQAKLDSYAMKNQKLEYQTRDAIKNLETKKDVQEMFGWNYNNTGNFRVGFDDGSGQWIGRKFNSLSEEDINSILNYGVTANSKLDEYRINETKGRLADYMANTKRLRTSPIAGASSQDLSDINGMINDLNQSTINKAAEAGERAAEREAEKNILEETAKEMKNMVIDGQTAGMWGKVKNFAGTYKKQISKGVMAMAALGIVNGIMNSNDSPLAPADLKTRPKTGTVGIGKGAPKTPNNVYANPTDGLNYKMSASSVKKINNMKAAQQLGGFAGGSTNVNVRDERKPVSDTWLQEKFSDYV